MMTAQVLPEIDTALCTGCGDCVIVCQPAALALVDGKAVLASPDRCQYDGACEPICPAGAIQLPYEIVLMG
jgi:NAD-dependent dihydropyrimidine dehydrogenase PreA subunit